MSDCGERRILRTIRKSAWHRAVGELNSMLETYWSSQHNDIKEHEQFERVNKLIEEFKEKVEEDIL